MLIIAFLQGLVFYGPVATLFRQSRGLSMYDIFLIESIFMVLMLVFEIPWGWFADRYGYKITLIVANLLLFVSKIVFYKAYTFQFFVLERVLAALAFAGVSGCDIALLHNSTTDDRGGEVFGMYNASSSAGFLLACLLSASMIVKSMDITVFSTIIPYGIATVLTFFIKDVSHDSREKVSIMRSVKDIFARKQILIIVLAAALASEVNHSIGVFLNQLQFIKSGINIAYFGVLTALMQIVCLLSAKAYKFTERFGQKKTIQVLLMNTFISCILLAYTKNYVLSVCLIAVIQGSFAITQPIILDIENKSISTNNRATMLSMYAMFGDIVASLVNISIGKFADVSIEIAFLACATICAISCALAAVYFRKNKFKEQVG